MKKKNGLFVIRVNNALGFRIVLVVYEEKNTKCFRLIDESRNQDG